MLAVLSPTQVVPYLVCALDQATTLCQKKITCHFNLDCFSICDQLVHVHYPIITVCTLRAGSARCLYNKLIYMTLYHCLVMVVKRMHVRWSVMVVKGQEGGKQ